MDASKSAPWIVAAALASVVILMLSWMFAISPTMTAAADARSQAAQERTSNDELNRQIATLAEQFEHLDTYKADLAALRLQIPEDSDLIGLNRELQTLATSTGVTLFGVVPGVPQAFVPVVPEPAAAPTTDAAAETGAAAGTSAATPPATPSAPAGGIYVVPVSVDVTGTYDQVTAFLSSFQTGSQRLFLATGITAAGTEASGATDGGPPTAAGDLKLTLAGYAYVLTGAAAAVPAAPDAGTPTPPVLPEPSGQRNPFLTVA